MALSCAPLQAKIVEAEAENNATNALEVKRRYELEWKRLEVLEKLAKDGRRFVSGPNGQQMIREMIPQGTFANTAKKQYF